MPPVAKAPAAASAVHAPKDATSGRERSVVDVLASVLVPFLAVYASYGLLAEDRFRYQNAIFGREWGDALTTPMQGTVIKVNVEEGAEVAEGETVVVLEAMKMENPVKAHKSGTVSGLSALPGATVSAGAVIASIVD